MSCQICCENFNKTTRAVVCCVYCNYEACRSCNQTFLLGVTIPKCMKCDKEWTRKFLGFNFTHSFLNGQYKHHREQMLFEKERAMLPGTQQHVDEVLRIRRINEEKKEIRDAMQQLSRRLEHLYRMELSNSDDEACAPRQFIKPCSVDNCRGFLSTQWKCSLCDTWACPDCHAIIGKSKSLPHTCDPNDVETATLIKKETRPCPTCHVPIYKISGCDQMWCTMCRTAFSFTTGKIQTKIHNPHYYEWLRETKGQVPREDHPDAYGGCADEQQLSHRDARRIAGVKDSYILEIMIQNMVHLNQVEIYRLAHIDFEDVKLSIRVKYMLNEIDEQQMKVRLQRVDKRMELARETQDVYTLLATAGTDITRRAIHDAVNGNMNIAEVVQETDNLSSYVNQMLMDIERVYKSKIGRVTSNFELVRE